jgi:nucleoside-diphosphate-sugar epimerase
VAKKKPAAPPIAAVRHKDKRKNIPVGRNSDNTMIKRILNWEPSTSFRDGLAKTYAWIEQQYRDRKARKRTVRDTI